MKAGFFFASRVRKTPSKMPLNWQIMPCVGLLVFLGCFTFIIVPDVEKPMGQPPVELAGRLPTVVIDPGHGGNDEGARSHGLVEKQMTLDVALRVEQMLRSLNFPTVLTRRDDHYVSLADRVAIANKVDNSIFLSIHFNQSRDGSGNGVETFYADQKIPPDLDWTWIGFFSKPQPPVVDNGETLAGFIQTSLATKLNGLNRGIKSRSLYVVRHTRSPAVLVEGGFISNMFEAQMLTNSDYRDRLAAAMVEGILSYEKSIQRSGPPSKLASSTVLPSKRKD
jgi:N-acetylmuramoyl-L-alanine amidase